MGDVDTRSESQRWRYKSYTLNKCGEPIACGLNAGHRACQTQLSGQGLVLALAVVIGKLRGLTGLNQSSVRRANQSSAYSPLEGRGAIAVVRLRQGWTVSTVAVAHGTAVGLTSPSSKSTECSRHKLVMRSSHVISFRGNVG